MVNIDYYSLGAKIKNKRKQQRHTQEQLSELCDISVGFLAHIEAGSRVPSLETIYKIALALNMSLDYLILDTAVADNNFIQCVTSAVQNKSPERYGRFCNVVKLLAEHIDEI